MTNDIFISYTQPNRNEAFAIHDIFEANEIKSWITPSKYHGISPGDNFAETIVKAIKCCKIFVLVYSDYVNISKPVISEVSEAKNKKIIIVRFDNSDYCDALSLYLSPLHYINGQKNNWLLALLSGVKKELNHLNPEDNDVHTDKFLLEKGLKLLENKMYREAKPHLIQYMAIEPNDSFARFALALSIIQGRKCKNLHGREVENLENILSPVSATKENGYIRVLLAVIKAGYYQSNGLRQTPPTLDELVNNIIIKLIKDEHIKMIQSHLFENDPENPAWAELNRLY